MRIKIGIFVLFVLFCVVVAYAAGPGEGSMKKGPLTIRGSDDEACSAYSVTAKWRLDSLLGEPLVNGSWKWTGSGDCEAHYSTVVWLKIQSGDSWGYIRIAPAIPKANKGYGFNTSGSPDWDELICGYSGSQATKCLPEKAAKHLWLNGQITDFIVASDNN